MLTDYIAKAARLASIAQRFGSMGLPRHWALNADRRRQLTVSNLDLLPQTVRRSPGVCIDVGANVGHWSLAALEMLHARRVLAFEPQPEVFASLAMALAKHPGAEAHQVGLGAQRSTMPLRVQHDSVFNSFLEPRPGIRCGAERLVTVDVAPLDEFTAGISSIDLLKLDVQGFERQVVSGAEQTLKRTRCVCVEVLYESHYAGDDSFDALHRLFTDRGFRVYGISAPALSDVDGRPLWADAVYVRT